MSDELVIQCIVVKLKCALLSFSFWKAPSLGHMLPFIFLFYNRFLTSSPWPLHLLSETVGIVGHWTFPPIFSWFPSVLTLRRILVGGPLWQLISSPRSITLYLQRWCNVLLCSCALSTLCIVTDVNEPRRTRECCRSRVISVNTVRHWAFYLVT